jgi:hypothetical protein
MSGRERRFYAAIGYVFWNYFGLRRQVIGYTKLAAGLGAVALAVAAARALTRSGDAE